MDPSPEPPAAPGRILPACFLPPEAHGTARHWGVGAGSPLSPMHPDHCQLPPAQPSPSRYRGAAKGYPRNTAHPGTSLPPPPADTEKQQVAGGGPAVTASAMGAGAGTWKSAPENPEDTLRLQPPGKVTMGAGMGDPHGRGSWVVLGHHSLLLGNWAALFPSLDTWPLNQRRAPPLLPPSQSGCPSCSCPGKKWSLRVGGCPIFGVVSGMGREGTRLNFPMQLMCFICSVTGGSRSKLQSTPKHLFKAVHPSLLSRQ